MKITDLIGLSISKIRYQRKINKKEGLQEFQAQIKLSNGEFILFPRDAEDKIELTSNYKKNKSCNFMLAQRCGLAYRLMFKKKRIVDVHFQYMNGEQHMDSSGIIELENGTYIMEQEVAPIGASDENLVVLNKIQFLRLKEDGVELRSYRTGVASI